MQALESNDKKFQFPRYLGLYSSKAKSKNNIQLEFGFSEKLRKSIKTDLDGLALLEFCFQPKSKAEVAEKFGLSIDEASEMIDSLLEADLLTYNVPNSISEDQKRYDRHLLFYQAMGAKPIDVQSRISESRVALIGMGGIGNWVSLNLIGAGLKELKLIDYDTIELSNLTRQILFDENSLGLEKAKQAQKVLAPKNTQTNVTVVDMKVTSSEQLRTHLLGFDFVVLSADKPKFIHDWVDKICFELGIAYLNIGYRDGEGVVGPLTLPSKTGCYQCFKPEPSESEGEECGSNSNDEISDLDYQNLYSKFDERYQAPSFGPLNSLVSSLGSLEVIKYLGQLQKPESLGVELAIDPMSFQIKRTAYSRDSKCWQCSGI